MVSIKTHLLKNGVVVVASIADESENFQSEETSATNCMNYCFMLYYTPTTSSIS